MKFYVSNRAAKALQIAGKIWNNEFKVFLKSSFLSVLDSSIFSSKQFFHKQIFLPERLLSNQEDETKEQILT